MKQYKINHHIQAKEVKLIDETGKFKGIYSTNQAINIAFDLGLDLVEVSPGACKILDYGKWLYEQKKKETRQKIQDIQEIRLSPNINNHDVLYKIKNARRILSKGNKVKLIVVFKGRQMSHTNLGVDLLKDVTTKLMEASVLTDVPRMEGKYLSVTIAPKK